MRIPSFTMPYLATFTLVALAGAFSGTSAFAEDCTIKLGVVGPLSGGAASWGLSVKEAADFVAAAANADGGLQMGDKKCKVNVYSFDSQYTAAGGAAGANYLASEGVHVTLGPVGSPETTGFRPVAARVGIINFSSSYMSGVISPEFPLAFHALQAPATWGPLLVKAAKDQFGFKSVIVVGPNDQGGTDGGNQLKKMYIDNGVDATTEYYQRGTTNFAPLVTRIMSSNPGAIELSTVPPGDNSIIVKQLLEADYTGVIGSLGGSGLKPMVDGAGGNREFEGRVLARDQPDRCARHRQDDRRLQEVDGQRCSHQSALPGVRPCGRSGTGGHFRGGHRPRRRKDRRRPARPDPDFALHG